MQVKITIPDIKQEKQQANIRKRYFRIRILRTYYDFIFLFCLGVLVILYVSVDLQNK